MAGLTSGVAGGPQPPTRGPQGPAQKAPAGAGRFAGTVHLTFESPREAAAERVAQPVITSPPRSFLALLFHRKATLLTQRAPQEEVSPKTQKALQTYGGKLQSTYGSASSTVSAAGSFAAMRTKQGQNAVLQEAGEPPVHNLRAEEMTIDGKPYILERDGDNVFISGPDILKDDGTVDHARLEVILGKMGEKLTNKKEISLANRLLDVEMETLTPIPPKDAEIAEQAAKDETREFAKTLEAQVSRSAPQARQEQERAKTSRTFSQRMSGARQEAPPRAPHGPSKTFSQFDPYLARSLQDRFNKLSKLSPDFQNKLSKLSTDLKNLDLDPKEVALGTELVSVYDGFISQLGQETAKVAIQAYNAARTLWDMDDSSAKKYASAYAKTIENKKSIKDAHDAGVTAAGAKTEDCKPIFTARHLPDIPPPPLPRTPDRKPPPPPPGGPTEEESSLIGEMEAFFGAAGATKPSAHPTQGRAPEAPSPRSPSEEDSAHEPAAHPLPPLPERSAPRPPPPLPQAQEVASVASRAKPALPPLTPQERAKTESTRVQLRACKNQAELTKLKNSILYGGPSLSPQLRKAINQVFEEEEEQARQADVELSEIERGTGSRSDAIQTLRGLIAGDHLKFAKPKSQLVNAKVEDVQRDAMAQDLLKKLERMGPLISPHEVPVRPLQEAPFQQTPPPQPGRQKTPEPVARPPVEGSSMNKPLSEKERGELETFKKGLTNLTEPELYDLHNQIQRQKGISPLSMAMLAAVKERLKIG